MRVPSRVEHRALGSGNIYAIPALATAILEIDVSEGDTELFGMLPSKGALTDKWNGGVLAPNGKIYGERSRAQNREVR